MELNTLIADGAAENDLQQMKGDRIGNTMYSERSVLKTLIKLSQITEFTSEFEEELCLLWDMTVEEDVVNFLMNNNFLDLATHIIMTIEDNRLIEIMVGIVGNMCCVKCVRSHLAGKRASVETFMKLLGIRDAPVLIQLIRVFELILIDIIDKPPQLSSRNNMEANNDEGKDVCKGDGQVTQPPTETTDSESSDSSLSQEDCQNVSSNWWEIYLSNTEIWFHNIPEILSNCKNDELLSKLWHLVDNLSDVACDSSIYLDEYFLNRELLRSLVVSFNEYFKECHPLQDIDETYQLRRSASDWIMAVNCFHNYEEGTDIVRTCIGDLLPCIQHILSRFSMNFKTRAESNKLFISVICFLDKSLPVRNLPHLCEDEMKNLISRLEAFLEEDHKAHTDEWEDISDDGEAINKEKTTECLQHLLNKARNLLSTASHQSAQSLLNGENTPSH
ncbi:uncharacterized protein LOC126175805 [Schistocerca cancellata]|uniref:uncharacterized protein LOC126175805 n=1 Tax=Schistocerca cancellata TaxID=274614 RepID=UPI002119B454|nr:uncharacterized protein LOC126175805 [Schistocerca cancellata]